jgi:hypothetical protein
LELRYPNSGRIVLDLGCIHCQAVDAGISMSQTMPINADLVDSLAQVILSLNDQELDTPQP